DRYPKSRLAPRALFLAATLDLRAEQDASAETLLVRLINGHREAPELPGAPCCVARSEGAPGPPTAASMTYRDVRPLAPASGYAEGASDRILALQAAGVRLAPLAPPPPRARGGR